MQPDRFSLLLNEKQVEQFNAYLASKSAHVRCPFCGHDYGSYVFAFVPAALPNGAPVSSPHRLVQAQCNNCAHVAHFNVPVDPA